MKKHINLIWLLIAAMPVLTAVSGCKKFLDRKPLGSATEGDLTQGGVEGKTYGLYGQLRTVEGMTTFVRFWFQSIRSDDAVKGSTTGDLADAGNCMENFQYTKDHWLLNQNWDGHVTFINATNDVIHDVDSLNLTDPGSITNKAEARFFRAFAYFDMVRDYGSVPIYTSKVYTAADGNKAKSTVAEVYQFIEDDLNYAAANLPSTWPAAYVGRVTKGTANSFLAKVLLYQNKWSAALAKCEEVINSGQYSLLSNYSNFFKESGENSSESIFEVQMYEILMEVKSLEIIITRHKEYGVRVTGILAGALIFHQLLLKLRLKQVIHAKVLLFFIRDNQMEFTEELFLHHLHWYILIGIKKYIPILPVSSQLVIGSAIG
jgi:hypothetical protein